MKMIERMLWGALLTAALTMVQSSSAVPVTLPDITPTSGTLNDTRWQGSNNSNFDAATISTIVGHTVTEVYKKDVQSKPGEPAETGTFANSYDTTYSLTPSDPSAASIEYSGGPYITSELIYLYVKDGHQDPAYYIFDISDWDGKQPLNLTGFWLDQGAISHVAIFTGGSVPDGGSSLLLLGVALISMTTVRNRLTKKL